MACNDICDQDCPHKVHRMHCDDDHPHPCWCNPVWPVDESDCEHPASMVGPWSTHGGKRDSGPDYYIVGWTCAACGLSATVGPSKGKPHFGQDHTS